MLAILCLSAAVILSADPSATGVGASADKPAALRPAHWAKAITLEGAPNLHKVSDSLYRSAQPTALGMQNLKKMGIKTVVNLRAFHSDRDELEDTGLGYQHIQMQALRMSRGDAVRFLKIVTDPKQTPVLVHCMHGADRTGAMAALYRVAVEGWSKEQAIDEMRNGGFNFHGIFSNLLKWLEGLDVESVKRDAGIGLSKDTRGKK